MAAASTDNMQGKICLVTGATDGVGKAAAQALAALGAEVILHGRNQIKAELTQNQIQSQSGNPAVHYLLADFEDLDQVRSMTNAFKERFSHLDVLVNNAGSVFLTRHETSYGIEKTLLVNHLAPFLLTNLLLETITASKPSRIVNVASGSHWHGHMDFEDLSFKKGYFVMSAYGRSKLANILFTYELARRLQDKHVTVNALTPGHVSTNIWRIDIPVLGPAIKRIVNRKALTPEEGADTVVYLASSLEVAEVTGKYFVHRKAVQTSPESYDEAAARKLWEVSARLSGLAQKSGTSS
jgi:NAD(P)-dependent dehydrogenase (short-subunit alcohol dehydrogenase family)